MKLKAQQWARGRSRHSPRGCVDVCALDSVFRMRNLHAVYTVSQQCGSMPEMKGRYEACRQRMAYFISDERVCITGFGYYSEEKGAEKKSEKTIARCNSAQKRHETGRLLQRLGYDCLVLQYSTKSEEMWLRKSAD